MTDDLTNPRNHRERDKLLRQCRDLAPDDRLAVARLSWDCIAAHYEARYIAWTARRRRRPLTVDEADAVAVLVGEAARLGYLIQHVVTTAGRAGRQSA